MARLVYPLALEEVRDMLVKGKFIDAIRDGDTRMRLACMAGIKQGGTRKGREEEKRGVILFFPSLPAYAYYAGYTMTEAGSALVPSSCSHCCYGDRIVPASVSQREFQVCGLNCDTAEGPLTEEPGHEECWQGDVLAQVKGLLAGVVSFQGRV